MKLLSLIFSGVMAFAVCGDRELAHSLFDQAPNHDDGGLVTDKLPMTVDNLLAAYPRGIYPYGMGEGDNARWVQTKEHGAMLFEEMRPSDNDKRFLRKAKTNPDWKVTFDQAFEEVITHCMNVPRFEVINGERQRIGTWINPTLIKAYVDMFKAGHGHSIEVYYKGALVAGIYGVFVDGTFSPESMFHLKDENGKPLNGSSDASKLAWDAMVEHLKAKGHFFVDTQLAIGLAAKWGARMFPHEEFMALRKKASDLKLEW